MLVRDFNCQLPQISGQSGASRFWLHEKLIVGPQPDQLEFQRIIKDFDPLSLASSNAKDGLSFVNDVSGSKTDHMFRNRNLGDR